MFTANAKRVFSRHLLYTNAKHIYPERVCLIETRKVHAQHQEQEGTCRCGYACRPGRCDVTVGVA